MRDSDFDGNGEGAGVLFGVVEVISADANNNSELKITRECCISHHLNFRVQGLALYFEGFLVMSHVHKSTSFARVA